MDNSEEWKDIMDTYSQMREDLDRVSRDLLLKQIIINQTAMIVCEMEREHSDKVYEFCQKALDLSKQLVGGNG